MECPEPFVLDRARMLGSPLAELLSDLVVGGEESTTVSAVSASGLAWTPIYGPVWCMTTIKPMGPIEPMTSSVRNASAARPPAFLIMDASRRERYQAAPANFDRDPGDSPPREIPKMS